MMAIVAALLAACPAGAAPRGNLEQILLTSLGVGPRAVAITFGSKTGVPIGYFNLCKTNGTICGLARTAAQIDGRVPLTSQGLAQLNSVNADVNRAIRPVSDMASHGVTDQWTVAPRAGDCEDYVLTKKMRLMKLGWPSSALLVALATTRRGEPHAVLIVRTTYGDLVLDNLTGRIRPWSPSTYRWTSIQSPTRRWTWHRFGRGEVMAVPTPEAPVGNLVSR